MVEGDWVNVRERVKRLRHQGHTYGEIRKAVGKNIPKSTLSEWCRGVRLPDDYEQKIADLNLRNLSKALKVAMVANKLKRQRLLDELRSVNIPVAERIGDRDIAKIALAMLCLGEASKYGGGSSSFSLGSSDPRIVVLFLRLLKKCFDFNLEKVRCTVQCRADQDIDALQNYWLKVTGVPKRLFYKPLVDPRTKGKPTKKSNYRGVLKVDYFSTRVQLELESLADLVYNQVHLGPEV